MVKLTGSPRIYMEPGVEDTLPGHGLEEDCGGKPLKGLLERDLHTFVRTNEALERRMILVRNAAEMPWPLRLAASFVGARVQEQILTPLLHFQRLEGMHIAFTKNFATHPQQVVVVARNASERNPLVGRPPLRQSLQGEQFLT